MASADGEVVWHVTKDGRFLGTVVEMKGGFEATLLALAGKARTQVFAERVAAARWLASLAPAQGSTRQQGDP